MLYTGSTIFCDDIREEISGKYSLIGCYRADMVFEIPPPVVIAKFCVQISIRIPISETLPALRVIIANVDPDAPPLAEINIDEAQLNSIRMQEPEHKKLGYEWVGLGVHAVLSPVQLSQPGLIEVFLASGTETERIGSIRVVFPTTLKAV